MTLTQEDKHQFNQFYCDNYQWLYICLYKHLMQHQNIEDIIQDTFLKLFIRPELLKQIQSPRSYLLTTAKNIVINQVRRKQIEQAYIASLAEQLEDEEQLSPEQNCMIIEVIYLLAQAMAGLEQRQQQILILHYIDGLAQTEIAARFAVSRKTVQKDLAKAIVHCHKQLQFTV